MPLQPTYTWTETESSIRISIDKVSVKNASQLFCSDRVVKLNAPPYLLLLDLKHAVDDDHSSASIIKGQKIVIQLAKVRLQHGRRQQAVSRFCDAQLPQLVLVTGSCRHSQACGTNLQLMETLLKYKSSGRSLCSVHTRSWLQHSRSAHPGRGRRRGKGAEALAHSCTSCR